MSKNINFDPDFSFEELDDERTIEAARRGQYDESSEEKCEQRTEKNEQKHEARTKKYPEDEVLEYYSELKALIDACGRVSHYWHMWHGLQEGVPKMEMIATSHQRSISYYKGQYRDWKYKAEISLARLKHKASKLFKVSIGVSDKDFLNDLTLDKGRRDAYKGYIKTYVKKREPHPITTLEERYMKRLKKRASRQK